jgi:hypothetical protein
MIVLFSMLFSKSGCLLEMCYIYLHLLTDSMEGVQREVLLLSDVSLNWNVSINFSKNRKYKISQRSVWWKLQ